MCSHPERVGMRAMRHTRASLLGCFSPTQVLRRHMASTLGRIPKEEEWRVGAPYPCSAFFIRHLASFQFCYSRKGRTRVVLVAGAFLFRESCEFRLASTRREAGWAAQHRWQPAALVGPRRRV
eukprot:4043120-Pleurochrysis_carterae.AAC.2